MKTRNNYIKVINHVIGVVIISIMILPPQNIQAASFQDGNSTAQGVLYNPQILADGTPTPPPPTQPGASLNLPALGFSLSNVHVSYRTESSKAGFISAKPGYAISLPPTAPTPPSPQAAALAHLSGYGTLLGLQNPQSELRLMRERQTSDGRFVERFQQVISDIPIYGAEAIVNLDAGLKMMSISASTILTPTINTQPTISADSARQNAIQVVSDAYALAATPLTSSQPRLLIYNPRLIGNGGEQFILVWQTTVTSSEKIDLNEFVLIDAQNGQTALHFTQIKETKSISTYTMNHSTGTLPGTFVCNQTDLNCTAANGDSDTVNAHRYANDTYNFYYNYHNRDSIDGNGMMIKSSVHYGTNYQNAFWDGYQMVYGDGFPVDDVVGHELTHGVTDNESNLIYQNQSGAINESFSDLWGEFIDLVNGSGTDTSGVRWYMGEDIPGIGAIRNMQNPPEYGDPDRMNSPYYYSGTSDNGGVHINSGVNNKAVYLMTDGGTFNGYTIIGLGITKTAGIYYEAQTNLLTSSSTYPLLAAALNQACTTLIGKYGITSADCTQVDNVTHATEMTSGPTPPSAPANNNFSSPALITSSPYQNVIDTRGATTESSDPIPSCGGGNRYNSVWYRYTPSVSGTITVNTYSSSYDTVLSIWRGTTGALTSVGCNDDSNNTLQSSLSFTPTSGTVYYFLVSAYSSGGGSLTFSLQQTNAPTPIPTNSPSPTPTQTPAPLLIDDAESGTITYGTGWNDIVGIVGGPRNGTLHYSKTIGSTLTIPFTGRGIKLIYLGDVNRGVMRVQINSAIPIDATINQYATSLLWQREWSSAAFTYGTYTLTLSHQSGQYVDLDAIIVTQ